MIDSFALVYLMANGLCFCGFLIGYLIADGLYLYTQKFFTYFVFVVLLLSAIMQCYIPF